MDINLYYIPVSPLLTAKFLFPSLFGCHNFSFGVLYDIQRKNLAKIIKKFFNL